MNDTQTVERSEARFISTDQNLRLVKVPTVNRLNASTGVLEPVPGDAVEFRNGLYQPPEGDPNGHADWLREHEQFNVLFFEQGNEPRRPDDPTVVLEAIIDAMDEGDVDTLTTIVVDERASHSRPEVLRAAARAIERVAGKDAVPAPPPTPTHELERFRSETIDPRAGASDQQLRGEVDNQGDELVEESAEEGDVPPAVEPAPDTDAVTPDSGESSQGIVDADAPTPQEGTPGGQE